jgi:thioredoxin 2
MPTPELDHRGVIVGCPSCGQSNRLPYQKLAQPPLCPKCRTKLSLPVEPIEVDDESAFREFVSHSALPVLVDFWAPWCGPCKMVAPEIARVSAAEAGRWIVAKVNTEDFPQLAQAHRVSAIPLLVLFKAGREIARQSGAMPATAIRQLLRKHAS